MKLIDFHTHAFPDAIAARAIAKLEYASGGMVPNTDGTVSGLRRQMQEQGVMACAVMNIATNPRQMHAVNDFAASVQADDIYPFGSVHPDAPDAVAELERIASLGLRGVKLHPEYQGFFADEERMIPIYRKISSLGLTVLFHAGEDFGFCPPYHAMPAQMANALRYLDTAVVCAHWGGLCSGEEVLRHLAGLPLYFDTSLGHGTMAREMALKIVEKHGCDKLLFGSDTPWHTPQNELRLLDTLELSEHETEQICYANAAALLQIHK